MPTQRHTFHHTILLAHGSRDPRWGVPFQRITDRVASREPAVSLAFMELQKPGIEDCVAALCERSPGCKVAVLPLFFSSGRHLREDVPAMIADIEQRYPASITLLPALGEQSEFADFVTDLVLNLLQTQEETIA